MSRGYFKGCCRRHAPRILKQARQLQHCVQGENDMGRSDDLIRRGARQRDADEVSAIVGGRNDTDNAEGRGSFSAVCDGARADAAAAELAKARRELMDNPRLIDGGSGRKSATN